nr:hypothetical protein [Candidatus Sigynarchaeota archaeon]
MYKFPLSVTDTCPHCGRRLGLTRKLVKCAYSGEVVCTKCIVGGRFSDSVWDKIPKEYQQKFRVYDTLTFVAIITAGLWLMEAAFWTNPGWDLSDLMVALVQLLVTAAFLIFGLALVFTSLRLPPLGTWLFYWWIAKPANKKAVEDAVNALGLGKYVPASNIFTIKTRFFAFMKRTRYKIVHFTSIGCNAAIIPLHLIIRPNAALSGTYFSAIAGVILIAAIITTLFTTIITAGFYCNKTAENRKQRTILELLSWLYALCLPLVYLMFPLYLVASTGFIDEIPKFMAPVFFSLTTISTYVQPIIGIVLNVYLLVKAKPDFERKNYTFNSRLSSKEKVLRGFSNFAVLIVIGILLMLLFFTFSLLVGDFFWFFAMLSSTGFLFGAVLPVVFAVLKLARRRPRRPNQPYWTLVKISAIMLAVFTIPALVTDTWTRANLDMQFAETFGADWRDQIPAGDAAMMHQVPFSWFDALYGHNVPINVRFTIPYCQDSPRYVTYPGGVKTNGTYKVISIVDTFVFDAYLPQGIEFGDSSSKLPVIIWFHGVGMDIGIGNMNYTSQYLANEGYLVCDVEFGRVDWRGNGSGITETSPNARDQRRGYDYPDTVQHVGNLTRFLKANEDFYHADLNSVYFGGRSLGAWAATICAYGYNASWMGTNFTTMKASGCLAGYGAHGIPGAGESNIFFGSDPPYIRGASDPDSSEYNPEWGWYDPLKLADSTKNGGAKLCPSFIFHGTNDDYVPAGWSRQLDATLKKSGYISIAGYYPLGAHGFDGMYWTQYPQNIHYYLERFLALTH